MEGASPPPVLSLEAGSPLTKPPSTVVQLQELAWSPQSVRKLDGDDEAIPEAGILQALVRDSKFGKGEGEPGL